MNAFRKGWKEGRQHRAYRDTIKLLVEADRSLVKHDFTDEQLVSIEGRTMVLVAQLMEKMKPDQSHTRAVLSRKISKRGPVAKS